jgi:hypothetical protein
VDYKQSWELVIKRVYPQSSIIRCSFHTVQLVNRALINELNYFSKNKYTRVIREVKKIYQHMRKDEWNGSKIKHRIINKIVKEFEGYYYLLSDLLKIKGVKIFKKNLNQFFDNLIIQNTIYSRELGNELVKRMPKRGLTQKGLKYYKVKVRAALTRVMRGFRRGLEDEKKKFSRIKYLLLKRPENFTKDESQLLEKFLKKNPEFNKYRTLSMRVSDIYHKNHQKIKPSVITGIKLWKDAHSDLPAAVKTLKKNVNEILNFIELFSKKKLKNNKKIPRKTPEPQMRKIKDLNRMKFGFRNLTKTQLLMQNKLSCQILITSS